MDPGNQTHLFDKTAIVYNSASTLFTTLSITWALYTVFHHPRLSVMVKFYLYYEHGIRMTFVLINYIWGVQCIVWYANDLLPWMDYIIGLLCQSLAVSVCLGQLALSINRFFAIAYGGRYYGKLFSNRWGPQATAFILIAFLPATVTLIPDNHTFFNTVIYSFDKQDGILSLIYSLIMQTAFALLVWSTTMVLDTIMLTKLHKLRKNYAARTTTMNTEWRLALQMIVNHLSNILNVIDATIINFSGITNSFHVFLLSTVILNVLPGLYGLNVVAFLSVRRKSRKTSAVLPKAKSYAARID